MSEEKKDPKVETQTSLDEDVSNPTSKMELTAPKYQFQDDKSFEEAAVRYYSSKYGNPSKDVVKVEKKEASDSGIDGLKEDLLRVKKMLSLNNNPDILDQDLVTDLLIKGWTLEQLRAQKPFLFKKEEVPQKDSPNKTMIAPSKGAPEDKKANSDEFVKLMINTLKTPAF